MLIVLSQPYRANSRVSVCNVFQALKQVRKHALAQMFDTTMPCYVCSGYPSREQLFWHQGIARSEATLSVLPSLLLYDVPEHQQNANHLKVP